MGNDFSVISMLISNLSTKLVTNKLRAHARGKIRAKIAPASMFTQFYVPTVALKMTQDENCVQEMVHVLFALIIFVFLFFPRFSFF